MLQPLKLALQLNADCIAFIDDDEIALPYWISRLFEAAKVNPVNVVEGGVMRIKTLWGAVEMASANQSTASVSNLPRVKTG